MNTKNIIWKTLSPISDDRLFEARAQLHQAAQLLAAIGISFLKARPDDSHTAMLWDVEHHRFQSQAFGENGSIQVSLNPADMEISIQKDRLTLHAVSLQGKTLPEAAAELQLSLDEMGLSKDLFTMKKHYELPDYPERNDTAFDNSDSEAFQVLADSFVNAFSFFTDIKLADSRVSDLLIWPHHFDLGLLITMATDEQGNLARSIGMGLSPGDGSYTSPYYYVTNWPAPEADQLPAELESKGHWHTEYWVGMVLPLEPITSTSGVLEQHQIVETFLDEALSIAKAFSSQK